MKEKLFFFSLYTCICQFCCYRIFVNRITFHFEATVLFFFSSSFSSLALLFWYGMDDESYRQNVNIMTDKRWIWYLLLRYRRSMGIGVECFANLFDKNKKIAKRKNRSYEKLLVFLHESTKDMFWKTIYLLIRLSSLWDEYF